MFYWFIFFLLSVRSFPLFPSRPVQIVLQAYLQVIEKTIKALKLSAKSPFDLSMLDNSIDVGFRDEDLDDIVVTASGTKHDKVFHT